MSSILNRENYQPIIRLKQGNSEPAQSSEKNADTVDGASRRFQSVLQDALYLLQNIPITGHHGIKN